MTWNTVGEDYYRSSDGRFEVMRAPGYWAVYDFHRVARHSSDSLAAAKSWCAKRAKDNKEG